MDYKMECRICYGEDGIFVHPCKCKGDINVHEECLRKWIETSKRTKCEICNTEYAKKEVFSCQCKKYFFGCINFHCKKDILPLIFSTFSMSIVILLMTETKDIFLMSSIVSSTMYIIFLMLSLKNMKLFNLDILCWWKLSYSLSLFIVLFVDILQGREDCCTDCILHGYQCVPTCPYYQRLNTIQYIVKRNAIFDILNIVFVFTLRSIYLCPKYHKKIVFDGYENLPLLTNGDDQVNSNC